MRADEVVVAYSLEAGADLRSRCVEWNHVLAPPQIEELVSEGRK